MSSPQRVRRPLSSPELLSLSMMLHIMGHPFGQFGSAVPALSPPSLFPIPSPLALGAEGTRESALMLCKRCSSGSQNTGVLTTLFRQKLQSSAPHRLLRRTSTPSQPSSALQLRCKYQGQWRQIRATAVLPVEFTNFSSSQVFFASVRSGGSSQVYFMTLGRTSLLSW